MLGVILDIKGSLLRYHWVWCVLQWLHYWMKQSNGESNTFSSTFWICFFFFIFLAVILEIISVSFHCNFIFKGICKKFVLIITRKLETFFSCFSQLLVGQLTFLISHYLRNQQYKRVVSHNLCQLISIHSSRYYIYPFVRKTVLTFS